MNLLTRQIWALVRKNLLLLCVRRPIYTFIRAFALPLVIVLIIAYSKNFFASPQHWGVSSPHNVSTRFDSKKKQHLEVRDAVLTDKDPIIQGGSCVKQ
jgi:ATP-binding cassette subfamily A (ABC1) protein 3